MNRKLVFLDIDGTLTVPGKNIPPESAVTAIKKAREAGNRVFLCTGRTYEMMRPLLAYGFDGFISGSGGYVVVNDTPIYDRPFTKEQTEKLNKILAKNGVFRTVECREGSFTDPGFKEFLKNHPEGNGNSELLKWREQIEAVLGILPMSEYSGQPVYKMVLMATSKESLERVKECLDDSFSICIQDSNSPAVFNGEVISSEYDKGQAVKRVCDYVGCPVSDTIGFGDSMNDLEMMDTTGISVCMENGSAELKKHADYVCPACDKDGIYQAFEKYGLFK